MNRKLAVAVVSSVAVLVGPSQAAASRPASNEEATAISALYETSAGCSKVIVSERDSRYARWDFVASEFCEPTSNGFGIARRDDGGGWSDVYQASEGSEACPTTPLPTEVGVELRACERPSRHVYIINLLSHRALVKPRRLPHGAHSFLGSLKWRGWDRSTAAASGVLDYADRTTRFKAPIRLRVSRVRFCGATRIYTRLTLTFVRSADRRRYPHFEGPSTTGCPRKH